MLNINEVRLMGTIFSMGEFKIQPNYSLLEIILSIEIDTYDTKNKIWTKNEKRVAVTFFGKLAEEVARLFPGTSLFIMGEVITRFNKGRDGNDYANTSVQAKKYQVVMDVSKKAISKSIQEEVFNFADDIPF